MMLNTEVKTHVIVFHDDTTEFITAEQEKVVLQISTSPLAKGMKVNGHYFAFSAIKHILEVSEYYDKYPDKIPVRETSEFAITASQPYKTVEELAMATKVRRNSLVSGLKLYVAEATARGEVPQTAIDKIKRIEGGHHDVASKEFLHWETIVNKYKDLKRNKSEEDHYQHALTKYNQLCQNSK